MDYWTRRRALQATGVGLISVLAGCSALSNSEETFLVSVNNYTESRFEGTVLIENDGTEVVRQYVEISAAKSDGWATVETEVTPGSMSGNTPLDVTASFGDMKATGQHTLDCSEEYKGNVIYVQIEPEVDGPNLQLLLACYDEFPSSEARQGGLNQS
ncbi:hypothetical protein [Halodesulfurarchaeum sp.]|uniref:hypothetical protein n=1 Tax=Halodesulfurarchaeum sp. TaxID=1980530 RepID=UPI002FC32AD8